MKGSTLEMLGDGAYAYLQPGGWGFSNAGLITSGSASLLVDTLYDLRLTRDMLATMRRASAAAARIDAVVNTHANGDHCWGNRALPDAKIISSRETAEEMAELSPKLMNALVRGARGIVSAGPLARWPLSLLGRLGVRRARALLDAAPFIVEAFGAFDFGEVTLRAPTTTFEEELVLTLGDKAVHLIQVGPAHTRGDTLVYVPANRVVFTGDILFMGSHPIMWEGPVSNWVRACDVLLALDVDIVVPGHGPLTDKTGVREAREYWVALGRAVRAGNAGGASAREISRALRADYRLAEGERVIVSVDTALRELAGNRSRRDPLLLLAEMARCAREPEPRGVPQSRNARTETLPSARRARDPARKARLRAALALIMMGMGLLHFAVPASFVRIVPAALPAPQVLVLVSGMFELLGGIGLLVPRVRRAASFGLVLLYLAVFPASVNMVLHPELGTAYGLPVWLLWARLPLQAVFIAWALSVGAADAGSPADSPAELTGRS